MSDKKTEGAKPEGDAAQAKPGGGKGGEGSGGGFAAWLPLLISIVAMPGLAFVTTKFLILPRVVQARESSEEKGGHAETKEESKHEPGKESKESKEGKGASKKKQTVQISKVIVNVAGSMGSRYLMTSFTVAGSQGNFKSVIEENKDQLLDLANTAMASKTISDLEKPGARNQLRAELISIFNNALGENLVQEIYFTEFAIQ